MNTSTGVEYLQLKSTALVHDITELNLEEKVESQKLLTVFCSTNELEKNLAQNIHMTSEIIVVFIDFSFPF